jgi:hypothetical protein
VISAAENSKKKKIPKNQVLKEKIRWGRGSTWANGTQVTLVIIYIGSYNLGPWAF